MSQILARLRAPLTGVRALGLAVTIALGLTALVGVSLVGAQRGEPDEQAATDTYQGCVNTYTGVLRILDPGQQCAAHETAIQLGGSGSDDAHLERIEALEAQVTTLQGEVASLHQQSTNQQTEIDDLITENAALAQENVNQQTALDALDAQVPACLATENGDAVFTGCNVHVRSGAGATYATVNGLGNLIVGYNENGNDTRTGSHNLVVGPFHSYSSYGGLVAGYNNALFGDYSSVSGGADNTASGYASSVSGGQVNTASGNYSNVSGGNYNTTMGPWSSVSGGQGNIASNHNSTVGGGYGLSADEEFEFLP